MKILLAPDSFKGALSAPDAAAAMARGIRRMWPGAECIPLPVADGGEGTAATLVAATGGRFVTQTVTGPLGEPVEASWGLLGGERSDTAVVEMAAAAGLTLVPPSRRDPKRTTTFGVGELLLGALGHPGVRRVIVGLGGSATNDGGAGILAAFGVGLRDAESRPLPFGGAALAELASVSRGSLRGVTPAQLAAAEILIASDVDNPLTGPRGASAVFGPQKGATPDDVALLDAALAHYATLLGLDPARPGLGAAGGTTAGLLYLFPHAQIRPGIDLVLDTLRFDEHLKGASLVLTGEGRLDAQTLGGKAIAGIARRAKAANVPVGAVVGALGEDVDLAVLAERAGVDAVLPLAPGPCSVEESMQNADTWLAAATERAARWMSAGAAAAAREDGADGGRDDDGGGNHGRRGAAANPRQHRVA